MKFGEEVRFQTGNDLLDLDVISKIGMFCAIIWFHSCALSTHCRWSEATEN